MKKTVSILVSLILVFTMAMSTFAAGEAYFEAMKNMNGNYEAQMEISMTVDKPFEILDAVAQSMKSGTGSLEYSVMGLPDNLKTLIESIFDTTSKMNVKVSMSNDYKKIAMEMSGNTVLPLKFGENLKSTTEMTQKMWLELDFSDEEKPVYRTIQLNPFMGDKYLVMDMTEMLGDEVKSLSAFMNALLTKENIEKIRDKSIEIIKNNAKITGSGNSYKLMFDDSSAKAYIGQIFEVVLEILNNSEIGDGTSLMPSREELDEIITPLSKINIFGSDGITYNITMKNGNIYTEDMKIQIDTNLYDIISVIDPYALEDEELFITRENSRIAFSINSVVIYSSVNKTPTIAFPRLTAENSVDMAAQIAVPETPDMQSQFPEYYSAVSNTYPIEIDAEPYIPVRSLFNAYGILDDDIIWKNGHVTVNSNGTCEYFGEISFSVGNAKAAKDGVEIPLAKQIVNYKGLTCVSGEFIEKVLGGKLSSIYFYASEHNWDMVSTEYLIVHEPEEVPIS